MQSISVFLDITKFADFRLKNADVSRTEVLHHVIHIFFGSSLGKVRKFKILKIFQEETFAKETDTIW